MTKIKRPVALVIMDGLGHRVQSVYNAVAQAHTPTLSTLKKQYPHALLKASGPAVGLLENQVGNSEVGHSTIGAGRIINQPIKALHDLVKQDTLVDHVVIKKHFTALAQSKKTLHVLGLISDAGVHAHIEHACAFIDAARVYGIKHIAVHAFLDGRDSPPRSAATFLKQLTDKINVTPGAYLASMSGRFYAMDRNNEWARTRQAYDMLTVQKPLLFTDWCQALEYFYAQNISDEFVPPTQLSDRAVMRDGDGVLFFNTRSDRARQLTHAFVDPAFDLFTTKKIKSAFFMTAARYRAFDGAVVLLEPSVIRNTLIETLCENKKTIYTIAETEKYAHVTSFFNGGREETFATETRVLIPSITAASYKDIPEMRAPVITRTVLNALETTASDFYLINYANPDMVGHSGDLAATIKAVECVDAQIGALYKKIVREMGGVLYITADHGNAEFMFDENSGQPCTAHTTNPVDFIHVDQMTKKKSLPLDELRNIAPFILKNMGVGVPREMWE